MPLGGFVEEFFHEVSTENYQIWLFGGKLFIFTARRVL